jgi:hypothetical protein
MRDDYFSKQHQPVVGCYGNGVFSARQEITFVVVGFEVFTAVVLKSIFFWDMTPCSP